jgi:hypothetical protein
MLTLISLLALFASCMVGNDTYLVRIHITGQPTYIVKDSKFKEFIMKVD